MVAKIDEMTGSGANSKVNATNGHIITESLME